MLELVLAAQGQLRGGHELRALQLLRLLGLAQTGASGDFTGQLQRPAHRCPSARRHAKAQKETLEVAQHARAKCRMLSDYKKGWSRNLSDLILACRIRRVQHGLAISIVINHYL